MKPLPDDVKTKSHRQGLYRLLSNSVMSPQLLAQPVIDDVRQGALNDCDQYMLVAHDWSHLNFYSHQSKKDRIQITHKTDVGYDLQSSLAVSDRNGLPIGCAAMNLVSSDGTLSSWREGFCETESHMDELVKRTQ